MIGVRAGGRQGAGRTDMDAHAVFQTGHAPGFGLAIAGDALDGEGGELKQAQEAVELREIAVNAVPHGPALNLHVNGFCHDQPAVVLHLHAVVKMDSNCSGRNFA